MKTIIMAGGEGSRLRPLTCDRPKPMVPIVNKPMMEHIVELLRRYGLSQIGVTLQYLPEQIREYFGDGSRFGVEMRYYIEETPLGTAGSVKNAAGFLDETFLVISGDALTDFDLQKAIDFHRQKGGVATLVLTSVEEPLEYGVVVTEEDGRILRFLEKPGWGEVISDTVNTGIYILEPEVLRHFEAGVKFDFAKDLFPLLMKKGYNLYGYVAEGYWCDIGNLQQYRQAHLDILSGKVRVNIAEKEHSPGIYLGENVEIEDGAELVAPVIIGSGCKISRGARVEDFTVLGPNCRVDRFASLKRGIAWDHGYVGARAHIRGAVLCNRVQVHRDAAVYEGAVIGDDTVIGERSTIKPGIKIWPSKCVESGSTVNTSMVWGCVPTRALFGSEGISGSVNLEITPELAAKLGVAYGSLLGEGSRVLVSSDDWKASIMLKEAAMAGLLSAGIKTYDLGVSLTPLTRRAARHFDVQGAIHVQLSREAETFARIRFLDRDGLDLPRDWERKIEQAFFREDFKRIAGTDVGETVKLQDFSGIYREKLLSGVNLSALQESGKRILLAYPAPYLYGLVMPLLNELNCEVHTISGKSGVTMAGLRQQFEHIATLVREMKFDLGAVIDPNAEALVLFDEKGRVVADEFYLALCSLILFRSGAGRTVAVPVTAPEVIEKLAVRYQGKVLRTKTAPRFLMEALLAQKDQDGSLNQFDLFFDAVAALVKILEFLAVHKTGLAELVESIPSFYVTKKDVACPWSAKGAVMRRIIEETRGDRVEILDGIKVRHDNGWALILPDPEKPVYRVFGEAHSAEVAEELTDMYVKRIMSIKERVEK